MHCWAFCGNVSLFGVCWCQVAETDIGQWVMHCVWRRTAKHWFVSRCPFAARCGQLFHWSTSVMLKVCSLNHDGRLVQGYITHIQHQSVEVCDKNNVRKLQETLFATVDVVFGSSLVFASFTPHSSAWSAWAGPVSLSDRALFEHCLRCVSNNTWKGMTGCN